MVDSAYKILLSAIEDIQQASLGDTGGYLHSDCCHTNSRDDIVDQSPTLHNRWRRALAMVILCQLLEHWSLLIHDPSCQAWSAPSNFDSPSHTKRLLDMIGVPADRELVSQLNKTMVFRDTLSSAQRDETYLTLVYVLSNTTDLTPREDKGGPIDSLSIYASLGNWLDKPKIELLQECLRSYEEEASEKPFDDSDSPNEAKQVGFMRGSSMLEMLYHCLRSDLKNILHLICAFGQHSVPRLVFELAFRPQYHWVKCGEQSEIAAPEVLDNILSAEEWRHRLHELEPLISVTNRSLGSEAYAIPHVFRNVVWKGLGHQKGTWLRRARNLMLYVFPKITSWSTSHDALAKADRLRPLVEYVLQEDPATDFEEIWAGLAAECEIAMAACVAPTDRIVRLEANQLLFQLSPELQIQAYFEKISAYFLTRKFERLERAIEKAAFVFAKQSISALTNAILGHISALYLQTMRAFREPAHGHGHAAKDFIVEWMGFIPSSPSRAEARALVDVMGTLLSLEPALDDVVHLRSLLKLAMYQAGMSEEDDLLHITRCRKVGKDHGAGVEDDLRNSLAIWDASGKRTSTRRLVTIKLAEHLICTGSGDAAEPFLRDTLALISDVHPIFYDDELILEAIERVKAGLRRYTKSTDVTTA